MKKKRKRGLQKCATNEPSFFDSDGNYRDGVMMDGLVGFERGTRPPWVGGKPRKKGPTYDSFRKLEKQDFTGGYRGEFDIAWSFRRYRGVQFEVYAVKCPKCKTWWGWGWSLLLARKLLKCMRVKTKGCPACR